jgi:TldD protein
MREIILKTVDFLKEKGVDYGDVRLVDRTTETISTEDMALQDISSSRDMGVGIKVILEGSMGFASTSYLDGLLDTALEAIEIARASKTLQREPIRLAKKDIIIDHYETPVEIDPFKVPMEEKINLLINADRAMRDAAIVFKTTGHMKFFREDKIYADTEGSIITQVITESGAGITASGANEKDVQIRSYPNSFGGNYGTAGYEYILDMDLVGNGPKIAREVVDLVNASECPSGYFDIIIDPSQLTLQIHESIGHPIELDRVFGSEAAYAGMSFLGLEHREEGFRYGSNHVNIVADATEAKGLGSFAYDDEGVKGQRTEIITKGIFKNFISSRDTAIKLGLPSNGTSRADGWWNIPIVRMTNISLMPGDFTLDELIKDIDYGLYLDVNKSWSIDDKRLNFQFACEIAYEIKDGKLTGNIFKNPVYTGITPEFWNSCDGVANEKFWKLYGTPNCGKGQPGQIMRVGHGASPARFRKVRAGVKNA